MAAGDTLITVFPNDNEPPASSFATFDTRNAHPVLDFDAATDEIAQFTCILPRYYSGNGITAYIHWAASTATSGNVVWSLAFERIGDEQQNLDTDGFATANTVTAAAPGTSGLVAIDSIAFTNGAQIDSIAVGESFRIRLIRDADNGSDTMAGDAELVAIELRETP